jgi:uncharacterized tellurite resistance protein B-like protein
MASEYQSSVSYPCPFCKSKSLECTATAPYVRGFLIAFQLGYKSHIGCVSCVRKRVLGEAGLSALIGWFSITAIIINPFLILYNIIQSFFVSKSPQSVNKRLAEMGLPLDPKVVNVNQVAVALAASMVLADGKVDQEEIRIAEELGEKLVGKFDEDTFRMILSNNKTVPSATDLASMLNDTLDNEGKQRILKYLAAIAAADGSVDPKEQQLLDQIAANMNTATVVAQP